MLAVEIDRGWYRCRRCACLVEGAAFCVGGNIHDLSISPRFKAPVGAIVGAGEAGWGACTQCSALSWKLVPGICSTGPGGHVFPEFSAEYYVVRSPLEGALAGWRKCFTCGHLFDSNAPDALCVSGGPHDPGGNPTDFSVPMTMAALDDMFYWCTKCQGLTRDWSQGLCVDGGQHQVDTQFRVAYGAIPAGTQQGWALCRGCTMLVFTGAPGACYGGAGGHDVRGSLSYSLPLDVEPVDQQAGWRFCSKCQTVTFTGFAEVEGAPSEPVRCPAGDAHDYAASGRYSVLPFYLPDGSPGWRICAKCRCLVQTSVSPGRCRDGGAHDPTGSTAYIVNEGVTIFGDGSWYWCSRCQGLSHGSFTVDGVCFDGAPHDHRDSSVHAVWNADLPKTAEAGWRRCGICKQLTRPREDGTTGLCANGGMHDVSASPDLAVLTWAPLPPAERVAAKIECTESAASVVVQGTGFTPEAVVEVNFVSRLKVTVVADATGAFVVEQTPVEAAPFGCYVMAKENALASAVDRLTQFAPPPT